MNMSQTRLTEKQYYDACQFTFKHFDKNQDSFLDKAEFGHILTQLKDQTNINITNELVDYIFNLVDSKKDGKIDIQEFYSAAYHYYYNK